MLDFREAKGIAGWGGTVRADALLARPAHAEVAAAWAGQSPQERLAVGCLRSYGDSCLASGAHLLDMTGLDRLLAFDPRTGLLEAEAGVTMAQIMRFAVPRGFFPATTPGTRRVTLGGAIANDVHGKNHHRAGTFGCSVRSITLARSDRGTLTLSEHENADLFRATIGGLGLTGIVLRATVALVPIPSSSLVVETIPFDGLDEFFGLAAESEAGFEHTVAWIDAAGRGPAFGRGIFSRANWAQDGVLVPHGEGGGLAVPLELPLSAVNGLSVGAFNRLYFARQKAKAGSAAVPYGPFFHPLDGIGTWNRLYGRRGFHQYQCVIPPPGARDAVAALLDAITRAGAGSVLSVLKTFGDRPSPGLLSFPMPGTTLAVDLPNTGPATLALLSRLDAIVAEANGRLYAAKEARVPAALFRQGYPELDRFAALVDPACTSDLWRRVSAPAARTPAMTAATLPVATTNAHRVIVLGATSAIAEATCRLYAAEGAHLLLVARDGDKLDPVARDLGLRGAPRVETEILDLATADAASTFPRLAARLGGVDTVLLAYGTLGEQGRAEQDLAHAAEILQSNFTSAALWCLAAASVLETQKSGSLVVIGSVAGDRGRQSNFVYGAAKAGLGVLVQGLAHRLARSGARAVLVKPGFVDTPMTAGIAKGGPLWSTPAKVAAVIRRAADRGGPVVYAPLFWRGIMAVIRAVPAPIMHRTRL